MVDTVGFLESKLAGGNLFMLLVKQVEKDFQMSVDSGILFTAHQPSELVQQVEEQLLSIINTHSVSKFSSLLYRVDVSETAIKNLASNDLLVYVQQVAYLILQREFKKVYIRNTYG